MTIHSTMAIIKIEMMTSQNREKRSGKIRNSNEVPYLLIQEVFCLVYKNRRISFNQVTISLMVERKFKGKIDSVMIKQRTSVDEACVSLSNKSAPHKHKIDYLNLHSCDIRLQLERYAKIFHDEL